MAKPGKSPKGKFYLYDNVAKRFVELKDGFLCGRLEGDLQFPDDKAASRRQCQFFISGSDVYLEDLNSTNRTKVNGAPVQPGYKRRLHLYDVIEFGAQRLILSHQDRFPANIQDRIDSGKLYPAARLDGGRLTSEISQVFTKKTLVLLDRATFRKLKLEEAFGGRNRRRHPREPGTTRRKEALGASTWVLVALLLLVWIGPLISLWIAGAFEEGLPSEAGELVLGLAVMTLIAGAVALGFYVRLFRPMNPGRKARAALVAFLALGAAFGTLMLTRKAGILNRVSQNLTVARCIRSWDEGLCRTLWELDHDEWFRLPDDLHAKLESRFKR